MRAFKFLIIFLVVFSLTLARPAYSAPLSLVVETDRPVPMYYSVGETVNFTGRVSWSNGSVVPDALVLFEVDTPKHEPWIIRTFTTGQTPPGPWGVELLSVTPCSDAYGTPKYSFNPGQDAGFKVVLRNNALTPYPVLVTINLFYSNGLIRATDSSEYNFAARSALEHCDVANQYSHQLCEGSSNGLC